GFLPPFPPPVTQYPAMAENEDVRDELFVTRVLFGVAPVPVSKVRQRGDNGQVFFNVEAQALKYAQFLEQFPLKTKHSFFCCHRSFAFLCCVLNRDDEAWTRRAKFALFVNSL